MAYLTGRPALTVFGWFSCAYFLSYALRSVNAVIAPDLVAQFGLSHAQLGALSAAYFLAFAMMQLKAIFSVILRDFEFEMSQPSESYEDDCSKMVIQLKQPCRVKYRRRVRGA